MLATQEAQVIPVTLMKHFCALASAGLVICDPLPLLTPALSDDGGPGRREGPEVAGLDLSWLCSLFTGSGGREQSQRLYILIYIHTEKTVHFLDVFVCLSV